MFERIVIAVVIWTVIVIIGTGAMSYRCGQLDERDRWRQWRSGMHKYLADKCLLALAASRPEAQPPQDEWQPITSAPKDGSHILVSEGATGRGFGVCGGRTQPFAAVAHWWDGEDEGWYLSSGSTDQPITGLVRWKYFDRECAGTPAAEIDAEVLEEKRKRMHYLAGFERDMGIKNMNDNAIHELARLRYELMFKKDEL